MSAASNYTEENIVNALLRGVTFPLATTIYVSLHTANPGEAGGNEVSTAAWPAYVRKDAAASDTIDTGWAAPTDGVSTNAKQIIYPSQDGAGSVAVTHWALYDAATAGNLLTYGALADSRTLLPGDVFVFDVGALTVQAS